MSRNTIQRCLHCGNKFTWYVSGYEVTKQPRRVGDFCVPCSDIVLAALEKVPVLFRRESRETKAWTVKDLLRVEKRQLKEWRDSGSISPRRVGFPLLDPKTGQISHPAGYVIMPDGIQYRYQYSLEEGPEKGKVFFEAEVNVETGEVLGPWRL